MGAMLEQQAKTLREAIPNLDHTRALTVEELDTFMLNVMKRMNCSKRCSYS